MADAHKNFAYSLVATAPSPPTTGISLVVTAGQGALFPAPPFNATVWPSGAQPTTTNAEIVRVTAIVTDTLTITRIQEGSTARSIGVGDQIAATITAKTLTDVEGVSGSIIAFAHAQTSVQDVTNTTTETEFYGVDLPQNTLTSGRKLVLDLWGDILENVAGNFTIRVKLGTTTVFNTGALDRNNQASRSQFTFRLDMFAIATNSQIHKAFLGTQFTGATQTPQPIGTGFIGPGADATVAYAENTSTEDNGAGLRRLSVTAQWSVADVNLSARVLGAKTLVYS